MSKERGPRPDHKYTSRKMVNGSWVYFYEQPPTGTPKRQPRTPTHKPVTPRPMPVSPPSPTRQTPLSPEGHDDVSARTTATFSGTKAPGTKEDLMRQVAAVGRWTGKSLLEDTARFTRETGFKITATAPGKRPSPNRVAVTRGTATRLLVLRHLVNVLPGMTDILSINVKASGRNAFATYASSSNVIDVHDSDTGHTVVHEFGHFLDHYLGNPKATKAYASNKRGSKMFDFVDQVAKTDSFRSWVSQIKNHYNHLKGPTAGPYLLARLHRLERRRTRYIQDRGEIVARFFDCWAHHQLKNRGFDTTALGTKPWYKDGTFSDADIEKLTPAFEAALGDKLKKSILNALRDLSWLAKQRTCSGLL